MILLKLLGAVRRTFTVAAGGGRPAEHPRTSKRPRAQTIAAKLSRKAARVASMSASLWAREVKPAS
jgi:hypothetical protein